MLDTRSALLILKLKINTAISSVDDPPAQKLLVDARDCSVAADLVRRVQG